KSLATKNPAAMATGSFQGSNALKSIAVLHAAEAPVVAIPIALTHPPAGAGARSDVNRRRSLACGNRAADDRATNDAAGNRRAKRALGARGRGAEGGKRRDRKQCGKCLLHVLESPGDAALRQTPGISERDSQATWN